VASCRLSVKAVPGASRDEIVGWLGDALKVRIQAPATDGKANGRLCAYLAETLGLSKRAVTLVAGASARQKIVSFEGLSEEEVRRTFASRSKTVSD
jgi:uncharacterized protein (TIGR00251 family)